MTWSNLSSFATGPSLWAESALSVVAFLSVSCLGCLSPIVLGLLPVLVVCSLGGCSILGVPLPLSSLGVCAFLCGAGFPSFLSLCSLTFHGFLRPILFLSVRLLLCYSINLLSFILFSYSWRRASGKFPSPPILLQLQFFRLRSASAPGFFTYPLWSAVSMVIAPILHSHSGRCAWLIHLSPLVRCVHGIASLARSHIGCCDRTCGDGPWSFFLPYRLLIRTCGDSWIRRLVSYRMQLCCRVGVPLRLFPDPLGRLSGVLDPWVPLTLW